MSLNNSEAWNQWSEKHSIPEQIKRQTSAAQTKLTVISIDKENFSAIFKGSHDQYFTTLSCCDCVDFRRRKLPCKHMYRLAYELGLFQFPNAVISLSQYTIDGHKITKLDKQQAMEIILKVLTPEEQKTFGYFCYRCGNDNLTEDLFPKDFADKLISHNLAIEVTDCAKLLKHLHIKEVRKFLPPGTKSPRTKLELIALVSPLVTRDDIIFPDGQKCLTLHPCVSHLGHTIHRQICALYPNPIVDGLNFSHFGRNRL